MPAIQDWLRSWRWVSWRSAVVAAFILYALIGFFAVPWIVKRLIEKKSVELVDRQATIGKVSCNPFTLSLTLEGFSIPDRPGSVLLSWDRVYANAQFSSLFRWAATLKELTVEGAFLGLRRFDDGAINVLEVLELLDTDEPDPDENEGRLPRVLLQQIRVVDARLEIEDRTHPERLLLQYGPNQMEFHGISTVPDRVGSNHVIIELQAGGKLQVDGEVVLEPLSLDGTLKITSLGLPETWRAVDYLFEFDLSSGLVDLDLRYHVELEEDGLHLTVDDGNVTVTDFGFEAEDQDRELLRVETVEISGLHLEWPEQNVVTESLVVDGASIYGWLEEDGTPSWDILVPKRSQDKIVEAYHTVEERISATAQLGRFELRNASARFEDRTVSPPFGLEVEQVELKVTDISSLPNTLWPIELSALLAGSARGTVAGTFGAAPLSAELEVALEGLELNAYQTYVERIAPLEVRAGVLRATGTVWASNPKGEETLQAGFRGGFGVQGLDLNETVTGDKLIGWGDLQVDGIDATLSPMAARVESVAVDRAGLEINVAEDGTINLLEFFAALGEGEEDQEAGTETVEPTKELPLFEIARLRLNECYGTYTDKTVPGSFSMALRQINGTVSGISTRSKAGARLDIDAEIDSGGLVRLEGEIDPLDYQRLTDLAIDVRDMMLPAVSPMAFKFIGHPIEGGDVSLDLDYDINDRHLEAQNRIEADDLVLGDKVEGEGQIHLPFKLGVSLLKDKEGRIVLEIPFGGDFDDEGFGMMSAAGAAAKEIMGELVKSPFRLLGKLGGGKHQDLDFVEFEGGSAVLDARMTGKLDSLAAGLGERPALTLVIRGTWDPVIDDPGLREATMRAELLAEGVTEQELSGVIPMDKLEGIFRSRASGTDLDALKASSTMPGADGAGQVLDEVAYRDALWSTLIAAQPLDPSAISDLGPARAEAIRAYLVESAGVDAARVATAPEATEVEPGEKETAASGSEHWVRCELELEA